MKIEAVSPRLALPGGVVRIEVDHLPEPHRVAVQIGDDQAQIVGASTHAISVRVPHSEGSQLRIRNGDESQAQLIVARQLPGVFNSVANPIVDAKGDLFITHSGARGEKVPFGVFRVSLDGEIEPFLADIVNPTAIAIGPDHCLYVSSRHLGTVYRSTYDKQVEKFADDLGVATGLVFDSVGNLIVGDRNGKVYRIEPDGRREVLCSLEPSVSAYHIVIDRDDNCYVSGPTLSTRDSIYRISPEGVVEVYFRGFGRPQGMAFDRQGNLQIAASHKGRKGIFTIREGKAEQTIAAPMLIGLAHDLENNRLYMVNSSSLFFFDWSLQA